MSGSRFSWRWRGVAVIALCALLSVHGGCDRRSSADYVYEPARAIHGDFFGDSALELTRQVTAFGARPAGSEALEKSRQWIEEKLGADGWQVQRQAFVDRTPQGEIEFVNLRARFVGSDTSVAGDALWKRPTGVLLASHYDTKFYEGIDFAGANDPGSSIGALLEIARVVATRPELARQLELVFFDGEEAFVSYSAMDGLYGSRHYAKQYRKWPEEMRMRAGVLLDMVGDRDLKVRIPRNSPQDLTTILFDAATELDVRRFFGSSSQAITDDHVPLNDAALPTIDVIDFDYAYWHTSADTIDKLSAENIEIVGRTVLLMVEKYLLGSGSN